MKTKIQTITLGICLLFGSCANASSSENPDREITACIETFVKAADQNDVKAVDAILNANYRIIMNRLFRSSDIMVIDKATYLEKIRTKEWGGDKRKVEIHKIAVNGPNATAKVSLIGAKSSVTSLFNLVQDAKGNWTLISDIPVFREVIRPIFKI